MGKYKKTSKIVGFDGDPCPRCQRPTLIYEHTLVTDKHRRQPFYYWRWFQCRFNDCATNLIMPERYRVMRVGVGPKSRSWGHTAPQQWAPRHESAETVSEATGLPKGHEPYPGERPPWEDEG